MNAPTKFPLDVEPAAALGKAGPTPADLTITVRDERFGRDQKPGRWWLNNDPVATAWHNALSATFPRGEAFFIEAVKAHREGAGPKLEAEIRAFIKQEINHTREHIAFNRAAVDAGYDLDAIDQRVAANLELTKDRPAILNLAVTMALEHYTAMMAQEFLANPQHFAGAEPETAAMWRWHAVEEIEHKGVAYDTWLHATKDWTRYRRWKVKSLMMLIVTTNFIRNRWQDTIELLKQDGLTGWKVKAKLAWYLVGTPGVLRRIFPAWCSYFLPGFHPWNHDDRALISKHDSEFKDAVLA
ncbi:metal-dependent hydrolase [Novosphingobium sp.]|uniref:metal-dependent hydrolase n=1 Tax=Novosphingobium sp. TaxID=1874826 RepID=UPI0022CC381D|nr:metal-dependent hydrolase [Novosphingobium sp.]MCZ8019809.1 metal-dependent hydrolase [Novosphingobium sp.]MCZ8035865.1 metal-dependent hydrolase [Novosphingobium sp.]MCZ8052742.1 metal-dependent hydrolase [Novosphingobium sp.]MCZ8060847.1 metal-dependent hydrolase [Novosphingobium sp.]MCZ8233418.1 metal-dependent hydrolase [Novosphingobium sp.]